MRKKGFESTYDFVLGRMQPAGRRLDTPVVEDLIGLQAVKWGWLSSPPDSNAWAHSCY